MKTFIDYVDAFRSTPEPTEGVPCRIAILNGSTITKFDEILKVILWENKIKPEIYIPPYSQHLSTISDSYGELYSFNPDIIFLHTDIYDLIGEKALTPYSSGGDIERLLNEGFERIKKLLFHLLSNCGAMIVFSNYSIPVYSPLGIHESGKNGKYFKALRRVNEQLILYTETFPHLKIFDFDGFTSSVGKNTITDLKLYYQGDIRIHPNIMPILAAEYSKYVCLKVGKGKKAIILDLDNTIWGGVAAEDGIENILLSPADIGKAYYDFQKQLAALHDSGILLAIASRNNEKDVWEVFEKHPYMVLKKEDFAAYRINWNDKTVSITELAQELSLGLDTFVFLDDDPVNREQVRLGLPEVFTPDMPSDTVYYPSVLQSLPVFGTLDFTAEDLERNKMYAAEKERLHFAKGINKEDYLKSIALRVRLTSASDNNISRIAQLTQKTNQFNMTTKRYGVNDIEKLLKAGCVAVAAYVSDRFGDSGLTGAAIAVPKDINAGIWEIDTFLLSCRVLGRSIEDVLLHSLLKQIKEMGGSTVKAKLIKTPKNEPAKGFYRRMGFALLCSDANMEEFVSEPYDRGYPEYITAEEEF
ncbi:MAG: HAD-IIIC family phosphatase [Deferribacteraceae bacterium]|nr:HAD-IIIC family phosphatase [Deferribacteraceae bacterium]